MPSLREAATDLRRVLGTVVADFRYWMRPGARTTDEWEAVVSVLLAIAAAHLLGARNIGWAAFSGYMVMRSRFSESLLRGSLRVIGTGLGAIVAWLLAPWIVDSTVWLSLVLGLVGWGTLYMALVGRRSYAWLFTGLTFALVLIDGMEFPREPLSAFAQSRFVEVFTGTLAAIVVSGLSAWTLRRRDAPRTPVATARPPGWHRPAFLHAMQGGVAIALIPWFWRVAGVAELGQSSTTILAVMMVPLASLASGGVTSQKLMHRLIGCTAGGLIASAILLAAHPWPGLLLLAVAVGVAIGRHIESGTHGLNYVGTQFVLAFLVVLVPDSYDHADFHPGLERLAGILFGMLLLEPVRLLARRIMTLRKR